MRLRLLVASVLGVACAPARPAVSPPAPLQREPEPSRDAEVRAVTTRFVEAASKKDFATVHALLSKALRERYTIARLAEDFANDPLATVRVEHLARHLTDPFRLDGRNASLEWAAGRALRLAREPEGWRITGLE
ncbi:MAG: hypothetical protein ACOZQL_26120 [Myxococcota bacterium]